MKFDDFVKMHGFGKSAIEEFVDIAYALSDHEGYFDPQDVTEEMERQGIDIEDICPHGYDNCSCKWGHLWLS